LISQSYTAGDRHIPGVQLDHMMSFLPLEMNHRGKASPSDALHTHGSGVQKRTLFWAMKLCFTEPDLQAIGAQCAKFGVCAGALDGKSSTSATRLIHEQLQITCQKGPVKIWRHHRNLSLKGANGAQFPCPHVAFGAVKATQETSHRVKFVCCVETTETIFLLMLWRLLAENIGLLI
jgi:hypothetical protein